MYVDSINKLQKTIQVLKDMLTARFIIMRWIVSFIMVQKETAKIINSLVERM
jgi:hypothetical protein